MCFNLLWHNSQYVYTGIGMDGCQTFGQKMWLWLRLKCLCPCYGGFKRFVHLFLKGSKSAKVVLA